MQADTSRCQANRPSGYIVGRNSKAYQLKDVISLYLTPGRDIWGLHRIPSHMNIGQTRAVSDSEWDSGETFGARDKTDILSYTMPRQGHTLSYILSVIAGLTFPLDQAWRSLAYVPIQERPTATDTDTQNKNC